jgi:hypothetical protein
MAQIFSDRNDGRACGVQRNGENLIRGNFGLLEGFASSSRQSPHVIGMGLRGVFRVFALAVDRILGDGGSEPAAFAIHKRNADAQGSKINASDNCHFASPFGCLSPVRAAAP